MGRKKCSKTKTRDEKIRDIQILKERFVSDCFMLASISHVLTIIPSIIAVFFLLLVLIHSILSFFVTQSPSFSFPFSIIFILVFYVLRSNHLHTVNFIPECLLP
jgi:hypothetical protein